MVLFLSVVSFSYSTTAALLLYLFLFLLPLFLASFVSCIFTVTVFPLLLFLHHSISFYLLPLLYLHPGGRSRLIAFYMLHTQASMLSLTSLHFTHTHTYTSKGTRERNSPYSAQSTHTHTHKPSLSCSPALFSPSLILSLCLAPLWPRRPQWKTLQTTVVNPHWKKETKHVRCIMNEMFTYNRARLR